jgi:hypothetical protein
LDIIESASGFALPVQGLSCLVYALSCNVLAIGNVTIHRLEIKKRRSSRLYAVNCFLVGTLETLNSRLGLTQLTLRGLERFAQAISLRSNKRLIRFSLK